MHTRLVKLPVLRNGSRILCVMVLVSRGGVSMLRVLCRKRSMKVMITCM